MLHDGCSAADGLTSSSVLEDLDSGLPGVGEERLANIQRGIQRFAALARFG